MVSKFYRVSRMSQANSNNNKSYYVILNKSIEEEENKFLDKLFLFMPFHVLKWKISTLTYSITFILIRTIYTFICICNLWIAKCMEWINNIVWINIIVCAVVHYKNSLVFTEIHKIMEMAIDWFGFDWIVCLLKLFLQCLVVLFVFSFLVLNSLHHFDIGITFDFNTAMLSCSYTNEEEKKKKIISRPNQLFVDIFALLHAAWIVGVIIDARALEKLPNQVLHYVKLHQYNKSNLRSQPLQRKHSTT